MFKFLGKLFSGTATVTVTIPLMIFPMLAFIARGALGPIQAQAAAWQMPSGAITYAEWGHLIIAAAVLAFVFEAAKATVTTTRGVIDHVLSVILLIASILAYVLMPQFGDMTWLLLIFFQLGDVLAGVIIAIAVSRRDFGLTPN